MLAGHATFAADETVGKRYSEYCSVCHGDRGDGRSHAQQGLMPPPRNFTDPSFVATATRERIVAAITNGVPGTAMIAWKTEFEPREIEELADYVLNEFTRASANQAPPPVVNAEFMRIYQESCSVCHGDDGKGAKWGQASLSAKPRDFTSTLSQTELTRDRMIVSVTNGRPGTPMPGFAYRGGRELPRAAIPERPRRPVRARKRALLRELCRVPWHGRGRQRPTRLLHFPETA
jgi:mono/diheme cytochrome c family protein